MRVHSFDKQHGTFKQFVSENSAGEDLILHCRKPKEWEVVAVASSGDEGTSLRSAATFLRSTDLSKRIRAFLHVTRDAEIDVRALYSEWTSKAGGPDTLGSLITTGPMRGGHVILNVFSLWA